MKELRDLDRKEAETGLPLRISRKILDCCL